MQTIIYPNEGTVTYGTLRNEDLIQMWDNAVARFMVNNPKFEDSKALNEARKGASVIIETRDYDGEEAMYVLEDLFEALNLIAPPGYMFSTLPGDGSDFGYWAYCIEDCGDCPHTDEGTALCEHLEGSDFWRKDNEE